MTPSELIDALRQEVTEDGAILLDKLEAELGLDYWPEQTFEAAKACFGPKVYARQGRTYKALDRRIRHALRSWDSKYGPLNPEQTAYADAVLAAAIRKGEREAGRDAARRYSFVQANIGRAINHEMVDGGFKKRGDQLTDYSAEVAEALAGVAA